MNSYNDLLATYDWDQTLADIYAKTDRDVINALNASRRTMEDFKALISPAAQPFLEQMARESRARTLKRFGNTIQMYAPMYLSNLCSNFCTYCGFSAHNKIPRRVLNDEEILIEADFLKKKGYEHILLVTGEGGHRVGVDYLSNAIKLLRDHFVNISIEVQPMDQEDYERLIQDGLYATLVYQETYHRDTYKVHHPKGNKSNFDYRLETPDRLGRTGIHKVGIGALLGLEEWRADTFFTALHLRYLEKKYWRTKYSVSFPRLRPCSGGIEPKTVMTDADLVQVICAYRLLDEDVELSISTRESATFRDHIVHLGVTTMSAESKTNPGGYAVEPQSLEQFEIFDGRSTESVCEMLIRNNLEPVWKDWERTW